MSSDDKKFARMLYDELPRGRKQEIDLKRREALKKAKDMPETRGGDTVVDIARGLAKMTGRGVSGDGSASADYQAARKETIRKAQDKADYKDVVDKEYKKGGMTAKGWGKARGARAAKVY
jgi:hypothetical protein